MSRGFLGDTVTIGVYDPIYDPTDVTQGLIAYGSNVVSGRVEFPNLAEDLTSNAGRSIAPSNINILANKVHATIYGLEGSTLEPGIFDGYVIGFSGKKTDRIRNVAIDDTNIEGLDRHSILYGSHRILINGSGLSFPNEPAILDLSVQFKHSAQVSAKHFITGEK